MLWKGPWHILRHYPGIHIERLCKPTHDSTDLTTRTALSSMVGFYGGGGEKIQSPFWESKPSNEFRSLVKTNSITYFFIYKLLEARSMCKHNKIENIAYLD